jgi:hypothetical protein
MNRNKRSLLGSIVVTLLLSACARDEAVLWREFHTRKYGSPTDRKPAQAPKPACFSDGFDVAQLKAEIKEMQSHYSTAKGDRRLTIGKRDYAHLHPALVDFLTAHNHLQKEKGSSWIATSDAQATCPDTEVDSACFVQKLYPAAGSGSNDPESIEGLAHYWFFLKTGVVMAAQTTYPWYRKPDVVNQSPAGATLSQYLFNAREWRAWWKMAHLLPPSMIHMPSLETVHRVPRGTHPEEWKRGQACGVSQGSWNSGFALFDDNCLRIHPKSPDDTKVSYFFPATTHEFGHRLSAWAFNREPAQSRIDLDESPDFLKLSGWRKAQLVTPEGKAQVQWESNPAAGYVSSFARINPSEDFAETVGYFRTNPTYAVQAAKEKYSFIKRLVYNNRGYTREELHQSYAEMAASEVMENVGEVLKPCFPNGVAPAAKPVPAQKFPPRAGVASGSGAVGAAVSPSPSPSPVVVAPTAPAVVTVPPYSIPGYAALKDVLQISEKLPTAADSCLRVQVLNRIAAAMTEIRSTEVEGCDTTRGSEVEIVTKALEGLGSKLSPYLRGEVRIVDVAQVTAEFRKKVQDEFDPRATLLLCWRKPDPRGCYVKSLEAKMEELFSKHGDSMETVHHDAAAIEKDRFRRLNGYDTVMSDTAEYYDALMTSQFGKIVVQAETVWVQCRSQDDATDLTTVKLAPYHAGTGYLPESVLSCINHRLDESEFPDLRAQAGADHEVVVVLPEANAWIDEKILLPRFKAVLDQKIAAAQAEDRKRFEAARVGVVDRIYESMIQGFDGACKAQAGKRLMEKFPSKAYRFLPLGPELDPMSNQICEKVRIWTAANAKRQNAQTGVRTDGQGGVVPESAIPSTMIERTPDALYAKLVPSLLAVAKTRFAQCRQPEYKSQRLRRYCLFTERFEDDQDHAIKNAWSWTRDHGVRAWLKDPEVVTYRQSKGYPEQAFFEAVQSRVDEESDPFVEAILDAFADSTE